MLSPIPNMLMRSIVSALGLVAALSISLPVANAAGPLVLIPGTNGAKTVAWPRQLIPALETNKLSIGTNVTALAEVPAANIRNLTNGYGYGVTNNFPRQFYGLELIQMSSNKLLTANVLNRLAYGPTPDDLEFISTNTAGPQGYIDQQLQPQNIPLPAAFTYTSPPNGTPSPVTNWMTISLTGLVSGTLSGTNLAPLYIYLAGAGDAYIDDVQLSVIYTNYITTNLIGSIDTNTIPPTTNYYTTNLAIGTYFGPNVVSNGDFELPFASGWTKAGASFNGSDVGIPPVSNGSGNALHIVATAAGSGSANAIIQTGVGPLTNSHRCVLTFSYLPRPNSGDSRVIVRLSGSGVISSDANPPPPAPVPPPPTWTYITATGVASGTPRFYLYLDGAGEVYIDDLKLVRGTIPEVGTNLLRNGDFEGSFSTNDWAATTDFTNTIVSTDYAHAGMNSLRLIATAAGSGGGDSVFQDNIVGVNNTSNYTVSFWYSVPTQSRVLTARFSGSATIGLLQVSVGGTTVSELTRRFETIRSPSPVTGRFTPRDIGGATVADLRAWFVQNAVGSPRQLIEVLSQFLENHFVTLHSKSYDYLDNYYDDGTLIDKLAADWEYREMTKWRTAMLSPNCTFYDLLKVHVESPAEIVYLDSVNSTGNGNNVANENYAREILELFCMGVDNGYEQLDITALSRAWTGWSVDIVDAANINNPFAPQSRTYGFYNGTAGISNLVGVWAFNYKSGNHGTNRAPVLSAWATNASRTNLVYTGPKSYATRFGALGAGTAYQIVIPPRTGTNSIQDGYDVIAGLANNLHTAEYLSIKLCRLFVHDGFPNPTTRTELPEYAFYDYTNPNRSAEAELVRQCIVAWQTPGPDGRKGNFRSVLNTIFGSALFRSHDGSLQKVKTPLEYTVSTIRALRAANPNGTFTSGTDGYSISGTNRTTGSAPIIRMGNMSLFNRDAPDGYPEDGPAWVSAGTLAERVRYVQTFLMAVNDTAKADGITGGNNNVSDPVGLLRLKLTAAQMTNAPTVVDYFLSTLYPAEGKANLDLYRLNAIDYLNKSEDGAINSLFNSLNTTGTAYDTRVRSMVGFLMALPRFQEQ